MSFIIKDNKVSFNIEIPLEDLIFNIQHRGDNEHTEVEILEFFEQNPQELEKFLKVCHKTIEGIGKNELDENDTVCEIAKQISLKINNEEVKL